MTGTTRRLIQAVPLLMLIALAMNASVGVGSSGKATQRVAYPSLARIAMTGPIPQLDYAKTPFSALSAAAAHLSAAGLYVIDPTGKAQPDLAASMPKYSDGGKTAIVKLRPNLKYSDGSPILASDFVLTYTRLQGSFAAFAWTNVTDLVAVGKSTLKFTLKGAMSPFQLSELLAYPAKKVVHETNFFVHPVSSGPYIIDRWTPGSPVMHLRANKNYWRGTALIQNLELVSTPDPTLRMLQLRTKEVQYSMDLPLVARTQLGPRVKQYVNPIGAVFWIGIDTKTPGPLSDIRVRHAISLAINRKEINDRAFHGIAPPVGSIFSRYRAGYASMIPNDGAQDVTRAKALLAAAGYSNGFSFPLQVWGSRPGWTDAALIIAEQLKAVGVTANVVPLEDAVALAQISNRTLLAQFSGGGADNRTVLNNVYGASGFWALGTKSNDNAATLAALDVFNSQLTYAGQLKLQNVVARIGWDNIANIIPLNERAVLHGSLLLEDAIAPVPTTGNLWVKVAPR